MSRAAFAKLRRERDDKAEEIARLRAALEDALIALATTGEDGCRLVLRKALAKEGK